MCLIGLIQNHLEVRTIQVFDHDRVEFKVILQGLNLNRKKKLSSEEKVEEY